ncbi:MAG: hypothetical protein IPJ77_00720 [Planctomycetes bacterium]|nr:hypothetical protein [Planctomycetota bacterium]
MFNQHLRPLVSLAASFVLGAAPALADGRNPGTLLVFPVLQCEQGVDTLITVTNANPDLTGAAVRVHFVYVSGDTPTLCQPTNAYELLTPQDTITVVASLHVAHGYSKGWVYVHAVDATGRAISYNHLIGDEIVFNGELTTDFAVHPFSFRAIPEQGLFTDLENPGDNVLDLNGLEYEQAPDAILIPRFMGQSNDFQSDLVLLNLSGGARFTANVNLQIFNDNEIPMSATTAFQCWTRVPLVSISSSVTNSFLQGTTNAPNEIIGANSRESGWILLFGGTAQVVPGGTSIPDPAILAVLIEKTGLKVGAELPFLQGTQPRGDILPQGTTWDGD